MGRTNQVLLVLQIFRGREFPNRPRYELICEARFDGERLSTDPVPHSENPSLDSELAWQLSRKDLHRHKLHRTPIRFQCYAVEKQSRTRELLGYSVLDIRTAQSKTQLAKWIPLLNSKYKKSKPSLLMNLSTEDDVLGDDVVNIEEPIRTVQSAGDAKPLDTMIKPIRDKVPPLRSVLHRPEDLTPRLHDEQNYYQVGPPYLCKDMFVLSFTIAFAANLTQLVPSAFQLPEPNNLYFFYTLLGNDVKTESFSDLVSPNFAAERSSVRIRSNLETLKEFFRNQQPVQVHLCSGDRSLGSVEISLSTLFSDSSSESSTQPLITEGLFQMSPPERVKEKLPVLPEELSPCVGLVAILSKVEQNQAFLVATPPKSPELSVNNPAIYSPPQRDRPSSKTLSKKEVFKTKSVASHPEHDTNVSSARSTPSKNKEAKELMNPSTQDHGDAQRTVKRSSPLPDSLSTTETHEVATDSDLQHHFRASIFLKTLTIIETTPAVKRCYLRYQYPFFGSSAPIMTHPAVEVMPNLETKLKNSFCAFDFATLPKHLQHNLVSTPLVVELWQRDEVKGDLLLGEATFHLSQLLQQTRRSRQHHTGKEAVSQMLTTQANVFSKTTPSTKLGVILAEMSLDDIGILDEKDYEQAMARRGIYGQSTMQPSKAGAGQKKEPMGSPRQIDKTIFAANPHRMSELQAAHELEIWKETQERLFEMELKEKERRLLSNLATEWKSREQEREELLKKKISQYTEMEKQVQVVIEKLEKREKELAANEEQVKRLRSDWEQERDALRERSKFALHQAKEEGQALLDIERAKNRHLEKQRDKLMAEVAEWEKRYKKKEEEFRRHREEEQNHPQVQLRSEVELLKCEKVELEKRLEAVTKSKVHYKQQWGKALKELAKRTHREQVQAKAELERQQQDLDNMKIRLMAEEQSEKLMADKNSLDKIKEEIQRLRGEAVVETNKFEENLNREENRSRESAASSLADHRVRELTEEREALINTGVYSSTDPVIMALDRDIEQAKRQRLR